MKPITVLAAASALALLAAPALAQTSGSPEAPRSLGNPAATMPQHAPKPNPLLQADVSQIRGSTVYGSDGKKVGEVDTVLMKPQTKQIDRLVVGAGGVLGIGAHKVALPISDFQWDAQKGGFTITRTEAELKAMPAWAESASGSAVSGSSVAPGSASTAPSH
jgi:sporulation protein YlmC with PRC-barrel domain